MTPEKTFKMGTWGAVYALLSKNTTITPAALANIVSLPGEHFGRFSALAAKNMTEEDVNKMAELVDNIAEEDLRTGPVPPADQGDFWLGFYKAGGVARAGSDGQRAGRPQAGAGIDWSEVDWAMKNAEIARQKGCRPQSVAAQRKKHQQKEDEKKIS